MPTTTTLPALTCKYCVGFIVFVSNLSYVILIFFLKTRLFCCYVFFLLVFSMVFILLHRICNMYFFFFTSHFIYIYFLGLFEVGMRGRLSLFYRTSFFHCLPFFSRTKISVKLLCYYHFCRFARKLEESLFLARTVWERNLVSGGGGGTRKEGRRDKKGEKEWKNKRSQKDGIICLPVFL